MDCFCLRKKTSYDFSSPYTMSSSGTYRTSVIEDSAPSKNGHVQVERDEHHHDSVISEEKHITKDVSMNDLENAKNDLHNDLDKDKESLKENNEEKDLHDVNRNHESLQTPEIVIDEVTEVNQVNVTLDDNEGHNIVSQTSVSSDNESNSNEVAVDVASDDERHSNSENRHEGQGHMVNIQGHDMDDLDESLNSKGHVSYEEEQNVRNSSYGEEQSEGIKVEFDSDKKQDHTPSYDVTAPTEDVPKDVVHMY